MQTSRGPVVIEGLNSPEEQAEIDKNPTAGFPPVTEEDQAKIVGL